MRTAELVNLIYFSLFTILAIVWSLPRRSRNKAVLTGLIGLVLSGIGPAGERWLISSVAVIVRDWLPAPVMALAYWQSGCFFRKADPRLQLAFENSDRAILRLLHLDLSKWGRTWIGGLLELAYVFCYPVVPLGLGALYAGGFRDAVDDYWKVVLLSAYPCYALLPFLQLLPPRLVEGSDAGLKSSRKLRGFNLWLVRHVTHEANTFPSGHVAASAAIAMVLLWFVPPAGIVFALIALGIAAGCVVGRYHYAVDVVAAVLLAGTVFGIVI